MSSPVLEEDQGTGKMSPEVFGGKKGVREELMKRGIFIGT